MRIFTGKNNQEGIELSLNCKRLLFCAGLIVFLISLLAMVGWVVNIPVMTSLVPGYLPISFNTAVMVFLTSLLLFSICCGRKSIYLLLLCALGCLIVLNLFYFSKPFHIHYDGRLLSDHLPSSIAIDLTSCTTTTLCYSLLFGAFLCLTFRTSHYYQGWLGALFASAALALSFVSLYGYLGGLETVSESCYITRMSLGASISVFVTSLALLVVIYYVIAMHPQQLVYFPSIMAFIIGLIIASAVSATWKRQISINMEDLRHIGAKVALKEVKARLDYNLGTALRFRDRLQSVEGVKDVLRDIDIANFFRDINGLNGIVIYDTEGKAVKEYFKKGLSDQVKKKILSSHGSTVLEEGMERPRYRVAGEMGDEGALALDIPLLDKGGEPRVMTFFFNPAEALAASITDKSGRYIAEVRMYVDERLLYDHPLGSANENEEFVSIAEELYGTQLVASVGATNQFLNDFAGTLPQILLATGSIISFVGGFLFFFLQRFWKISHDLERANKAKSMFLANVSHEVRTPLHGIIGTGSLLEMTPLNDKQERYVKIMMISAKHLLDLVNGLLDINKIEADRVSLTYEPFDLRELCQAQIDLLTYDAKEKGLTLSMQYKQEGDDLVLLPPQSIKQILLNLLGNAIKFTQSGSVTLKVEVKHLEGDNGEVSFDVIDTGKGIPLSERDHIFGKFYQAVEKRVIDAQGYGLGLFLSKLLVEKMNGAISFDSMEGKGTTFFVDLPLKFVKRGRVNESR